MDAVARRKLSAQYKLIARINFLRRMDRSLSHHDAHMKAWEWLSEADREAIDNTFFTAREREWNS